MKKTPVLFLMLMLTLCFMVTLVASASNVECKHESAYRTDTDIFIGYGKYGDIYHNELYYPQYQCHDCGERFTDTGSIIENSVPHSYQRDDFHSDNMHTYIYWCSCGHNYSERLVCDGPPCQIHWSLSDG